MQCALLVLVACLSVSPGALAGFEKGAPCYAATVAARDVDVYHIDFEAGGIVYVEIEGDRTSNLRLAVFDEDGRWVASDSNPSDRLRVIFAPAETGTFAVSVVNDSDVEIQYTVCVE